MARPPVIIRNKITPPSIERVTIARPRLGLPDDGSSAARLILIKALAGYGKTTLLHQYQKQLVARGHRVAWLRLDAADNEKTKIISYVIASLSEVIPELSGEMEPAISTLPPLPLEDVIGLLVACIEKIKDDIYIVIDDYHFISNNDAHDAIHYLLVNMPNNLHCVLASRSLPPWNVGDTFNHSAVRIIDESELRFTRDEVAQFLLTEHGLSYDPDELEAFCQRTDGWITAIRLVAMSLDQDHAALPETQAIVGARSGLVDYLAGSVLDKQDQETQDFLLQTAPLERLCASLCDAVTGNRNARRMLDKLRSQNLFLEPLDANGEWFQYHSLFAEFLNNRLARHPHFVAADIHRKASFWFEVNRQPYAAAEHALAAGDPLRKESLIEAAILSMVRASQLALAIGWFESLPDSFSVDKPNVLIPMAWSYMYSARYQEAEKLLARALDLLNENAELLSDADRGNRSQFLTEIELAMLEIARVSEGRVPDRKKLNTIKASLEPGWDFLRAYVDLQICHAWVREDHLETAFAAATDTVLYARKVPNAFVANLALAQLANIRHLQGHNAEAMQYCSQAINSALDEAGTPLPIADQFHLIAAKIHYEGNDLTRSRASLEQTLQLTALKECPDIFSETEILAARHIAATHGEQVAATRLFKHNISELSRSSTQTVERVRAFVTWFLVGAGDLVAAEGMMRQSGVPLDRTAPPQTLVVNPTLEIVYLALARYLIATGKAEAAANWLRHLLRAATDAGRIRSCVRINGMLALAMAAREQEDKSHRYVREMLQLGEQGGFGRTIVDLGDGMIALLDAFRRRLSQEPDASSESRLTYVEHLLAMARDRDVTIDMSRTRQRLVQPGAQPAEGGRERLTARELQILELIAMGKKNRDVARELLIAESSVRWHVRNLFSKLDVFNRTEASVKARALKLIY